MATLLIIDDSTVHRGQIAEAVSAAAIFDRVVEAEDGFQGLKCLLNERIDVVLCDLEMPGLDGEKLLHVKQATPRSSNVPFVFLTASGDLDRRVRLLETGAADLIVKPFHLGELIARLRLHLRVKQLQDELRVKNETLARLSTTDVLTGLRTRRYANEVLSIEFLRARRYHSPLTVLMADLDHFKQVNDTYGHPTGDAVLRGVGGLLLSQLRGTDIAGRYGGEEIIVVLAQSRVDGGRILAERWRRLVEETQFESADGQPLGVQLSIGVAGYRTGMETPEEIISRADAALYRAKDLGRNRVVVDDEGDEPSGT